MVYVEGPDIKNLRVDIRCQQPTVVPTKSDSDVMFCFQNYQGLRNDRLLVY